MKTVEEKFPTSERPDTKRVVLTIDSRSRENPTLTTPSDYTIRFPPIRQVAAANLISAEVPNSQYVINASNNRLDFIDVGGGTGTHVAIVTPGSYAASDLAIELDRVLNAALGFAPGFQFLVTYIAAQQKMRITRIAGGNFSLIPVSGPSRVQSIGSKIGFTADVLNVSQALSQQVVNLAGENYVFLTIERFQSVRTTEKIPDVFGKIIWNVPPKFICFDSFIANTIEFREPITSLQQLRIRFVQQDGSLYDFNGLDHSLSIELFLHY